MTKKALQVLANGPEQEVRLLEVIRGGGELIAYFPGGIEGHASRLRETGLRFDAKGEILKMRNFKGCLWDWAVVESFEKGIKK